MPVVIALLIMMIVAMLLTSLYNWTIEKVAYRPLRGSFRLAPLITAIGMSIALSNFVQVTQGPRNKPIPPLVSKVYTIEGVSVSLKQIIIVLVTAICLRSSGIWSTRPRLAGRSAPASRTARWRRCSVSTSTVPSPSPSSWARPLPPSPARCS
ncbi:hypothetical protein AJ88_30570 [Mesorhizobium amorphae CCBAU 01583]|nr:hypothetical protein AJ88_30570 [Mesorhizobium amorphae CCBAU 01583]